MDHNTDPDLDLSIATLARAARGDVKNLPSFMVHNDAVWPNPRRVQLDSQNRIHLRRSTFLRCVARELPVRAGIWHRMDLQEFHLDLQPHHLQGSADMAGSGSYTRSRLITKADAQGRMAGDDGFGITGLGFGGADASGAYRSLAQGGGKVRGRRSAWLSHGGK